MKILVWIICGYCGLCHIVATWRKRHDSRFHYAANSEPTGNRFGSVAVNVGGKMEMEPVTWLDGPSGSIQISRHATEHSQCLPDRFWTLLAPLYWRVRLRRYAVVLLLAIYSSAALLWWTSAEAVTAWLEALRPWVRLGLPAMFVLSLLGEALMTLCVPSRHPAVKQAHRFWRFLTFQPNPEPDPALLRERQREWDKALAEHRQGEAA